MKINYRFILTMIANIAVWASIIFLISCNKEIACPDYKIPDPIVKYINNCDSVEFKQLTDDYNYVTEVCAGLNKKNNELIKNIFELEKELKNSYKNPKIIYKNIKIKDSFKDNQENNQISLLIQKNDSLQSVINNFSPVQSPIYDNNRKEKKNNWFMYFLVSLGVNILFLYLFIKSR
jgi:hypothetical protein